MESEGERGRGHGILTECGLYQVLLVRVHEFVFCVWFFDKNTRSSVHVSTPEKSDESFCLGSDSILDSFGVRPVHELLMVICES